MAWRVRALREVDDSSERDVLRCGGLLMDLIGSGFGGLRPK